jgi:hypothetical protein
MTRQELMTELVSADGAILYWQLPQLVVEAAIAEGLCRIADDDCLVHRDAIRLASGTYTMGRPLTTDDIGLAIRDLIEDKPFVTYDRDGDPDGRGHFHFVDCSDASNLEIATASGARFIVRIFAA